VGRRGRLTTREPSPSRARDPLAVWNGVLVDGHNRFEICSRLGLPFDVSEVDGIADRNDAIEWIIRHQFGRRNLDLLTRGELSLKLKSVWEAKAAANLKLSPGRPEKGLPTLANLIEPPTTTPAEIPSWAADTIPAATTTPAPSKPIQAAPVAPVPKPAINPVDTRAELAKAAGVSIRHTLQSCTATVAMRAPSRARLSGNASGGTTRFRPASVTVTALGAGFAEGR